MLASELSAGFSGLGPYIKSHIDFGFRFFRLSFDHYMYIAFPLALVGFAIEDVKWNFELGSRFTFLDDHPYVHVGRRYCARGKGDFQGF